VITGTPDAREEAFGVRRSIPPLFVFLSLFLYLIPSTTRCRSLSQSKKTKAAEERRTPHPAKTREEAFGVRRCSAAFVFVFDPFDYPLSQSVAAEKKTKAAEERRTPYPAKKRRDLCHCPTGEMII